LSYLAFARFAWDPSLTWEQFLKEDVAPLLGGDAAAERYLELVDSLDHNPVLTSAELAKIQSEALEAARNPDDDISRRWMWLANRAAQRRFTAATRN